MKIGNTPGGHNVAGTTAATPRDAGAARPAGATAATQGESATVKLSSTASALLDGEEGGFDAAKVDRIRQSISDGTYKINAEAIADKLIANAQEVLGKVSAAR